MREELGVAAGWVEEKKGGGGEVNARWGVRVGGCGRSGDGGGEGGGEWAGGGGLAESLGSEQMGQMSSACTLPLRIQ